MAVLSNAIRSAVWWAYTISVNGLPIGNLQTFSPTASRTIERVREILFSTGPKALEVVPGATDISATMERIRLFQSNLLQATGNALVSIEDFNEPIDVLESLNRPGGSDTFRTVFANGLASEYGYTISVTSTFVSERSTWQFATVREA